MKEDFCCDTTLGGEYYLKARGLTYEGIGDLTLLTAPIEKTANATANGGMYTTHKAKLVTAKVTFANRCKADPMKLHSENCPIDVVFVEKSRGIRHLFTQAVIVGNPEINASTGEVSGIEIACAPKSYLRTKS
jgi:hypothetical protein